MAPLIEAPPVRRNDRHMGELGDVQQAGRSQSSLGAESNSAELQSTLPMAIEARRHSSGPTPQSSSLSLPQIDRRASSLSLNSLNRRPSYVPAVPSPLNPSSSSPAISISSSQETTAAEGTTDSSSSSSGNLSASQIPANVAEPPRGKKRGIVALSPAQQMLRQKSASALRQEQIARPGSPRRLQDLGWDYTRYPLSSITVYSNPRQSGQRLPLIGSLASSESPSPSSTANPFTESKSNEEKFDFPDDFLGALDPYYGGEKGFILFHDEVEADDKIHLPADDDNLTFKVTFSDRFHRDSIVSTIGAFFLILGLLCVFIGFPILTYTTNAFQHGHGGPGHGHNSNDTGPAWAHVNNNTYPLLKSVRRGLIDPDTPASAKTRQSTFDGSTLNLVFSDEFNQDNRTFYPGDDPYWTAPNIWYGSTQDIEWYDPDAVTTGNGTLQLRMDAFTNHNLPYRSGMLNSWNQLCFKGGVFEVSISLPGPSGVPGLWPGVWTMGNLGRPGYKATTEGVWPYTYNSCDAGITPNQSSPDGISHLPGQKLSACSCKGEDHPSPGTGRGAPEIDILEGSVDPNNLIGVVTQSFQVAPFDVYYRPNNDFLQIPNFETTSMNGYCGGPFQQAISGTTLLNNDWYDGNAYQKYAFEYIPGTSTGKIAWFVGEDQSFMMDGRAIGPNGNIGAREVSQEPMALVLNLGISSSWSEILFERLKFPTVMHIDYVRIYQKPGETSITCDPPGYPTTEYINNHADAYNNPNLTAWNETGYGWPKNTLTGC